MSESSCDNTTVLFWLVPVARASCKWMALVKTPDNLQKRSAFNLLSVRFMSFVFLFGQRDPELDSDIKCHIHVHAILKTYREIFFFSISIKHKLFDFLFDRYTVTRDADTKRMTRFIRQQPPPPAYCILF